MMKSNSEGDIGHFPSGSRELYLLQHLLHTPPQVALPQVPLLTKQINLQRTQGPALSSEEWGPCKSFQFLGEQSLYF